MEIIWPKNQNHDQNSIYCTALTFVTFCFVCCFFFLLIDYRKWKCNFLWQCFGLFRCHTRVVKMYITFLWCNKTSGQCRPHTQKTEMTISWFNGLLSSYQTADFLLGLDKDVTMLHSCPASSWCSGTAPRDSWRSWDVKWHISLMWLKCTVKLCRRRCWAIKSVFTLWCVICSLSKYTDFKVPSVNLIKTQCTSYSVCGHVCVFTVMALNPAWLSQSASSLSRYISLNKPVRFRPEKLYCYKAL